MSGFVRLGIVVFLLGGAVSASPGQGTDVALWTVDPLEKVFRDTVPAAGAKSKAHADVARGEHASLQVVVRASVGLKELRAQSTSLRGPGELPVQARFVGYVPVDRPTQKPSKDQLRQPPFDFPDPLLEVEQVSVAAGQAQPVWLTVAVPLEAKPGLYKGKLRLRWVTDTGESGAEFPLSVRVHRARVEKTRLWVTDWFSMQWRHMALNIEPESDAYYALLERYARNMAEHRHNVALISPLGLAYFLPKGDSGLQVDFRRFDRWVEAFQKGGVLGRIEGGHIGGREAGWDSQFVVTIWSNEGGKVVSKTVRPDTPEADRFYAWFFPALVRHLKERGWLESYLQHLADEPIKGNLDTYRAMAALLRKYAPELKIVEACHSKDLVGAMDVWVPQLNYFGEDIEHYRARQAQGEEVWFYTCVFPQGEYANRFIEQPLLKTRLLHWINYRYGATGYLHWGYNQWTEDSPFTHTTRPHGGPPYLPAGDPWIVYPGSDGPLDSIRFEAMRDGIVDHELLSQLGERDTSAAQALACAHVRAFDQYNTDVAAFRKTRLALLKKLSK